MAAVDVVVLPLVQRDAHRHDRVRDDQTGSINSGVEEVNANQEKLKT